MFVSTIHVIHLYMCKCMCVRVYIPLRNSHDNCCICGMLEFSEMRMEAKDICKEVVLNRYYTASSKLQFFRFSIDLLANNIISKYNLYS